MPVLPIICHLALVNSFSHIGEKNPFDHIPEISRTTMLVNEYAQQFQFHQQINLLFLIFISWSQTFVILCPYMIA